jgi:nitronate monooxygenase
MVKGEPPLGAQEEQDMAQGLGNAALAARLRSGLRLPVLVAPMFLVSGPELVLASCRAGVIGALPAHNARTSAEFGAWLQTLNAELAKAPGAAPYAVNIVVHKTNSRIEADIDLCIEHKAPIIVAAVGSPKRVIADVHAYGGMVLSDVGSVQHARKAAEAGADGLILLCAGAGGNTGWLNPFAFVSEVRKFYDGPLMLAGAISRGAHVHIAELLGADLAVVGTSFIAARESLAKDAYRQMLIDSNADDIVLSADVTGVETNMLRKSLEQVGFVREGARPVFDFDREMSTLRAWRDIWGAGHGVGDVTHVETVEDIVARFARDYELSHSRRQLDEAV